MKRVQNRKEKLCEDDVISDVEQDENFNNDDGKRSEEHTSELQSRPHISYAVFCLKKKKTQKLTTCRKSLITSTY